MLLAALPPGRPGYIWERRVTYHQCRSGLGCLPNHSTLGTLRDCSSTSTSPSPSHSHPIWPCPAGSHGPGRGQGQDPAGRLGRGATFAEASAGNRRPGHASALTSGRVTKASPAHREVVAASRRLRPTGTSLHALPRFPAPPPRGHPTAGTPRHGPARHGPAPSSQPCPAPAASGGPPREARAAGSPAVPSHVTTPRQTLPGGLESQEQPSSSDACGPVGTPRLRLRQSLRVAPGPAAPTGRGMPSPGDARRPAGTRCALHRCRCAKLLHARGTVCVRHCAAVQCAP